GVASASGRSSSMPPCMIGAVIMKMISSTNATSIRFVRLISELMRICCRRELRIARMLEPPLARERADELARETVQLAAEAVDAVHEVVVRDRRRNRRDQSERRGHQRFRDAGRD